MHLAFLNIYKLLIGKAGLQGTTWIKEEILCLDFEKVQRKQLRNGKLSKHMRHHTLINKEN